MRGLRLTVPPELDGERLDVAIARLAPEISRRMARRLIGDGAVLVHGQRVRVQSRLVPAGAVVEVHPPTSGARDTERDTDRGTDRDGATIGATVGDRGTDGGPDARGGADERDRARNAKRDALVLALDADLVVADKPPGMPTEPTRQGASGTLSVALADHLRARGEQTEFLAAAHRLDTHTSGVVVFARSRAAAAAVAAQMKEQSVERRYLALVAGVPPFVLARFDHALAKKADADGRIHALPEAKGGLPALTFAAVLARGDGCALVWCAPRTGRTHQLRVHLADAGHPLVDDHRYARPDRRSPHPGLHALTLTITHPTSRRPIRYAAPPPPAFVRACAERGIPAAVVTTVARALTAGGQEGT
jgi:RluA family pseudouridine synthase